MKTKTFIAHALGLVLLIGTAAGRTKEAAPKGPSPVLPTDTVLGHGYVRRDGAIHFIGGGSTGTGANATRIDMPSLELLRKVVNSQFGSFKTAEGLDVATFEACTAIEAHSYQEWLLQRLISSTSSVGHKFPGPKMALTLFAAILPSLSLAQSQMPAELLGHAILPANTMLPPPADAPRDVLISGKFTGPGNLREDRPGTIIGRTGPEPRGRETGLALPFNGQPVQGFSSMKAAGDGAWWLLTDNGFGNQKNSPDALLMWHRARPDFATGRVAIQSTTFLRDPDGKIPFRITSQSTTERYLTGADLDVESLVVIGETVWLGDEFGPYLIRADLSGRVTGFFETDLAGVRLRSPEHHSLQMPATPAVVAFEVPRSGGFEGMATTPDGSRIWAMLEKPLLSANGMAEGRFLHVLAFDPAAARWTGTSVKYALEKETTAIGDLNMIDTTRALVIERDDGQGDPARACAPGTNPPGCFENPARFKRVYVVDFAQVDTNGFAKKLAYIDLMNIHDPENRARQTGDCGDGRQGRFTFPFYTIETVAMVDATTIMVGNDNNLPFSAGRFLHRPDDNEFILLRVPELLDAK